MKHRSSLVLPLLRALVVAAACGIPAVWADEYADISQLLRAGKLSEAMTKVDVLLAAKPRDPQLRFYKGVILRDSGKLADAIATFTKLTEDYPELPEPYNNLAVLYAGQNQFDKARAALEMAIRTNPSYATAHENLGDVYAMLASQAYNKALQLDKANAAVPPKLALIRELFSATPKASRPAASAASSAKPVAAPTPAPAPAPVPTPVPAPAPAAVPATPATSVPAPAPVTPAPSPVAAVQPKPATSAAAAAPPTPAVVKPAVEAAGVSDVEKAVESWAKAWSSKDLTAYLAAYGKDFDPAGKQSRSEWESERRKRIAGKNRISVKIEKLAITVTGNKAVATFRQEYRADALAVSSRKTLDLVKSGDRWVIVRESTGG